LFPAYFQMPLCVFAASHAAYRNDISTMIHPPQLLSVAAEAGRLPRHLPDNHVIV